MVTDGHRRAAYEPAMIVALLLSGYARGTPSSRAIERAYGEDVAFRVLRDHDIEATLLDAGLTREDVNALRARLLDPRVM